MLIHGLGLTGALWNRVRDSFGPGYQLVLVDLRGAGKTRELRREELSLERWADDLAAVLGALDIRQPVLVGHSLGASIALKVALERPDDVRCARSHRPGSQPLEPRAADARRGRSDRDHGAGGVGGRALVDRTRRSRTASLERDPSVLEEYRSLLLENDPDDYVRQCRAIAAAESLAGRLGDVTQPALVIIGGSDDRTLPEHGRRLAEELGERTRRRAPGRRAHAPARSARGDGDGGARIPRRDHGEPATGGSASCAPTRRPATRPRGRSGTSTCAGWSGRRPARH